MKTIPYNGRDVPLPEMAMVIGVPRATLAWRWRKYAAGKMTMEQVLCREKVTPPAKVTPPPAPDEVERLRALLETHGGHYPPMAAALGITRSGVHKQVKAAGLTEFARDLRKAATAPAG